MKRVFFAALGLVAIFITGACSSATEEKPSAQANGTNSNTNTSVAAVENGATVSPPLAADPNAANAAAADPMQMPGANRLDGKLKALKDGGGAPIDNAQIEAMARKNARPAPDNSTFTSYLTDAGYEIRTFNNHPQLLKVEKRIGTDSQSIKVFLRGGRVVELPGSSITALASAPASSILSAAGVQQNTVTPQRPSKSEGADAKKPGN